VAAVDKDRQLEISRQMTRLIDVVYGLVLVQGAIFYRSLFTIGDKFHHFDQWAPVVAALVLIYFTAIQSFVDFHIASEEKPYRLLGKKSGRNLTRFYLDVVIVGLYSFLLLKCHVLITDPGADLTPAFWAFPVIFVLYIVWGILRCWARPGGFQQESKRFLLLGGCLAAYLALAIVYANLSGGWNTNLIFLLIALAVMLIYRGFNWLGRTPEAEPSAEPAPSAAKPAGDKAQSAPKPAV
jgi:uncharacterized membrane protein